MKKLFNAVFAALLITAPALAGDAFQLGTAGGVPAAKNMATAQVTVGSVATKLVLARARRLLLQVECSSPGALIGSSSSLTTLTGFLLPYNANALPAPTVTVHLPWVRQVPGGSLAVRLSGHTRRFL
jgi:hypothetical protein